MIKQIIEDTLLFFVNRFSDLAAVTKGRLYLHSCVNNSEFICTASIIGLVWLLALSET